MFRTSVLELDCDLQQNTTESPTLSGKKAFFRNRLFGETARSVVVPKSTDLSAKIIFPTKKCFFTKGAISQ